MGLKKSDDYMLRHWLGNILHNRAVKQTTKSIKQFITELRAISDEDMGMIIAMATKIRLDMMWSKILSSSILNSTTYNLTERSRRVKSELKLSDLISEFEKKNQGIYAMAAMVWLHTIRALTIKEIHHSGKKMWDELQRGFPFAAKSLKEIRKENISFPSDIESQLKFIPPMFEMYFI